MDAKLEVALKVYREQFLMEEYRGEDDIFALVKKGKFQVEGENSSFTVCENEGALFRKNIFYHRRVLEAVTLYLFRYTSDTPAFGVDHVVFQDTARIESAIKMLEKLDEAVYKDDFSMRRHLFEDFVMLHALENGWEQQGDRLMEAAILDMKNTLHSGVNLSWIAEKSGLSYVQFLRRFKRCTGLSPSEYVTVLRLQKAKELLTAPSLRVKQIARACGFENEYYFSNFFKKHTGRSPTAFRASVS